MMTQLLQIYVKFVTLIIHVSLSYGSCRHPRFVLLNTLKTSTTKLDVMVFHFKVKR